MEVLLNTLSVTLSVEELTTLASLEALRTDWAALWKRCSAATPFQTPEWLIAWWKHLGHGQLWVLAFRQQTRLVAVAPLLINHEPRKGREVLFLGTGVTDYLDILSEPELEALVSDTLLAHLHANSDLWDHCDFQELRGGSPLLRLRWPEPWASEIMVQEVCPVLSLPEHASE